MDSCELFSRHPGKKYGFTLTTLDAYLVGMVQLSQCMTMWLHPVDMLRAGHKVIQTKCYAEISTVIDFPYPVLTKINGVDDLDHLHTRNITIKRAYSEPGEHVLSGDAGDYEMKSQLKAAMDLTRKHWSTLPTYRQPVWFVQPLLPTMSENCEVRCFFVGMEWLYSVATLCGSGGVEAELLWESLPLPNVMYAILCFLQ
jgi:hypothetical protein